MTDVEERIPPSPEVQREEALRTIEEFSLKNEQYRLQAKSAYRHPSTEALRALEAAQEVMSDSADPIVSSRFFRNLSPALVEQSTHAVLREINENNVLAALFEGVDSTTQPFDDEFRSRMVEKILGEDVTTAEEGPIIIASGEVLELPADSLIVAIGAIHGASVGDVYVDLMESEKIIEYEQQQEHRKLAAAAGIAGFLGAAAGAYLATRLPKKH